MIASPVMTDKRRSELVAMVHALLMDELVKRPAMFRMAAESSDPKAYIDVTFTLGAANMATVPVEATLHAVDLPDWSTTLFEITCRPHLPAKP